ncbi:MAG: trypsin-like peptidase domain-containing protein, partial [Acidobacteriota bacterium]
MKRTAQTVFLATIAGCALLLGFVAATAVSGPPSGSLGNGPVAVVPYAPASYAAAEGPAFYERHDKTSAPVVTLPDFADIFERVNPAVVSVRATKFNDSPEGGSRQRFFQDPFQWFFGPGPGPTPNRRNPHGAPQREESGGTGFVITPDGYILTNFHVIEDAERVHVRLNLDGRDYEGRVVGSDPPTDIALVKISVDDDIPYLPLGDSSSLRVGEWVMAIGNPFFYNDTVTVGVVSAKGRRLQGLSRDPSLDDYIQTDAAINVGNSGGPLLNVHGEVIGINSAVSRVGQGIGFAIPIDMAKTILPQLRRAGKVSRGAMGVEITDLAAMDPDQREYFGLNDVTGALVQTVVPGQAAAEADLHRGDAILAIDGHDVTGSDDLIGRISARKPGDTVDLLVLRDGHKQHKRVVLQDRQALWYKDASNVQRDQATPRRPDVIRSIGIEVADLDDRVARTFNLKDITSGVAITDVSVRGQGYEKGLRPGMVIVEVNKQPVKNVDDYVAALADVQDGDLVTFYVQLDGGTGNYVTFRVSDP